jgi:hypothetical protein
MPPSVEQYRWRVANVAIGATTLRNQGATGVNRVARAFLAKLALADFLHNNEQDFLAELDRQTVALMKELPPGAQHWGTARKALNVFLGEVYYHRVLCPEYGLHKVAEFLEMPLDGEVARFLKKGATAAGRTLPRWRTIKTLTSDTSRQYQEFAAHYAKTCGEGWTRLHLDLIVWRSESKGGAASPLSGCGPGSELGP